jgi:hypothetical protein
LVYKNDGKKVYYPFDPPPYIDGVRINSPHYLAQVSPGRFETLNDIDKMAVHKNVLEHNYNLSAKAKPNYIWYLKKLLIL